MSATPQGVEDNIHDMLMAKLAPEEPEQAEPLPEETEELEAESSEELEAATAEGDDVEEVEVEESVEAEPSEIEAQESEPSETIELAHIAEYLGANEDQFTVSDDGELFVKTKIDGQEGQAKFSDLLKSYQLEGHLNKQSTELAETQKALQSKLAETEGKVTEKIQQLEDLSQIAYNELLSEYNTVNWNELKADDPAEYSAKMIDFQNRQNQIAQLYQQAQDQRGQQTATQSEVSEEKIAQEKAKLLEAFPSWSDQTAHSKDWVDIGEYAMSQGLSAEAYQGTTDASLIIMMDKARKYDALQKESSTVTKKVKKAPKIAKPGSTAQRIPSAQAEKQKRMKQLKRDGGGSALHELLLERV